jgi:hypothetical protein
MAAALSLWDKEFRENPDKFENFAAEMLKGNGPEVSKSYGQRAAATLVGYITRVRIG